MPVRSRNLGFTLVELVVVIIILGILGTGVFSFVGFGTQAFVDTSERQRLLASSRFAVQRINRELRSALPNSLRLFGNSSVHCLEFIPIAWSGTYTRLPDNDTSMRVVDLLGYANGSFLGSEQVVVYPIVSEEIYAPAGANSVRAILDTGASELQAANVGELATLAFSANHEFPRTSPASRYYLIDGLVGPVSYCTDSSGQLRRYSNYGFADQASYTLPPVGGVSALMAEGLGNQLSTNPRNPTINQDDPFRLVEASLARNALVQLLLRFERNQEQLVMSSEVHIANVP